MAIAITFGGYAIEGIASWKPSRRYKVTPIGIPRRQGALIPQVAFSEEMRILLTGEVKRDTSTDLRDYFNALGAVLFNGRNSLTFLDDARFAVAICAATAFPSFDAGRTPATHGGFSIEFICGDPFFYAGTEESNTQSAISSSPHAYTITNNGPIRTPVQVEITAIGADKTDVTLTNSTVGQAMRYRGTIVNSGTLIMDGRNENNSCTNSGVNALNDFEGSHWLLEPGVNNLVYTGPISVTVVVRWSQRFIN